MFQRVFRSQVASYLFAVSFLLLLIVLLLVVGPLLFQICIKNLTCNIRSKWFAPVGIFLVLQSQKQEID